MKQNWFTILFATIFVGACWFLTQPAALAQRVLGLDISAWQGNISQTTWNNIRNVENRQFVFFRASRGGTSGYYNQSNASNTDPPGENTLSQRYDDPYFVQNMNRSTTAGIFAGSYHFSRPDIIASTPYANNTANTGTDEADHFIQMAGAFMRPGYLYPVHDFEAGQGARTSNQMAQFCIDFSDQVFQIMGIRPAIYVNGNYANGVLGGASSALRAEVVTKYPIHWNARWPNQSNPNSINVQSGHPKDSISTTYGIWDDYGITHPWAFWQYASTGRLQSYNNGGSNLDFNVCQGDIEYLKDFLVPALWLNNSNGDWATLANWNCGQAPIVPVPGDGQVPPVGTQTLPTPRVPGASGSGVTSGMHDTVIIDRPSAQITVTYSSGIREIRKLFVREQLNITGGELIVNYNPEYPSNTAQYPAALRSGSVSAQFTQPVSITGNGSLSVHTLQVEPQASLSYGGGQLQFCRVYLAPDSRSPARLELDADLRLRSWSGRPMLIAGVSGGGQSGVVDLGGHSQRRLHVDGENDSLTISVPVVDGGLVKDGKGLLVLSADNSYSGDTEVRQGELRLKRPSLHANSRVALNSGARLTLDYQDAAPEVQSLWIDSVQQPAGLWGAQGSKAQHTSPLIQGQGLMRVLQGPAQDSVEFIEVL